MPPLDCAALRRTRCDQSALSMLRVRWCFAAIFFSLVSMSVFPSSQTAPEDDIAPLIAQLRSHVLERKSSAASRLAKMGAPVLPVLIEVLEGGGSDEVTGVLMALREMGVMARPALPAMLRTLVHEDPRVRERTAYTLAAVGKGDGGVTAALIRALQDCDEWVRLSAALTLVGINPKKAGAAVPVLAVELKNHEPYIRQRAAWALENLDPSFASAAAEELIAALRDSNNTVKVSVADTVRRIPSIEHRAIPALIEMLESADPTVGQVAAMTLGGFGATSASAISSLLRVASPREAAQPVVRYKAIHALGSIASDPDRVTPVLLGLLRNDPDDSARAAAAWALGSMGCASEATIGRLKKALEDPSPGVVRTTHEALIKLQRR